MENEVLPPECNSTENAVAVIDSAALRAKVAEKEEKLRKLRLVEMYRKKWSKDDLLNRGLEWRNVAQRALMELFGKYKQGPCPDLTIGQFLGQLNVKPELIGYDTEDEAFED